MDVAVAIHIVVFVVAVVVTVVCASFESWHFLKSDSIDSTDSIHVIPNT